MSVALVVLHILVCIFLVAVVLLQRGKGAEIGAVFGGGASGTVFGSRGAGNFLTKLTTLSATIFMLTSLSLSYFWSAADEEQLFTDDAQQEAPLQESPFEELGTAPAEPDPTAAAESDFVELDPTPAPAPQPTEPAPTP